MQIPSAGFKPQGGRRPESIFKKSLKEGSNIATVFLHDFPKNSLISPESEVGLHAISHVCLPHLCHGPLAI